jgi:hypothetical protein
MKNSFGMGVILLLNITVQVLAQEKFTLSGFMRDSESGEELLQANISIPKTSTGTVTNEYGFYSFTLAKGSYSVRFSYLGYKTFESIITLDKNIRLDIALQPSGVELNEIVISGRREDGNIKSTDMGVVSIDIKEAKLIPVLFGEQDVLKMIQLLPGVSPNSEGGSGFFVRGGDTDQNLVLLDEAPVYNTSHLLGFFSVFNSDALKDVKLYKGAIPAQFGGRISSVLDIRMKDGNTNYWEGSGGLGLISSRFTLEGPLLKNNGSIIISGRRTYADLLLKTFSSDFSDLSLYFYDLNLKANYNVGDKDRFYLSGYFGRDVFGNSTAGFNWGNMTGTIRWNHIFNDQLFSNTSIIYSDFDYGFKVDNAGSIINLSSGIFDYNMKNDFIWYLNPENTFQFGWNAIYHQFKPGDFTSDNESSGSSSISIEKQRALETGLYISNEQKFNEHFSALYGLRISMFSNIGPYEVKTYNVQDEVLSTTIHGSGNFYNTNVGLEPRLAATYLLDEVSSIKSSFGRSYQYLHLLSNSTSGTPTDIWIPSSPLVKPEIADQISLGYFRNFESNAWEFSIEGYYKNLQNQVDYEDGAQAFLNPNIEAELVFGKGRAYGAELFLRKNKGNFTGWISYTLSKSERQYDEINNGNWFSARQDRIHNFSVVGMYQLSPTLTLSANWVYSTGDAVTFPTGKYSIDGAIINLFSSRNEDRMPDYHRLDLGLTWTLSNKPGWRSDISFSIYNVYNRRNAYTITFQESKSNPGTTEAVRLALFGIVPSITWNFKF